MTKSRLSLIATTLVVGAAATSAASWDTGFPAFPTLGENESISAICYFQKLYVAVNSYNPNNNQHTALLYRLDGTSWNVVQNSTVSGTVYALSAASSLAGTRLFVGGSFASVGPSSLAANNIAMLTPTPTNNPGWTSLGTGAANGTDGAVYSIRAQTWYDNYFGTLYDRIMVYAGGQFTTAGNLTTPSIASWSGLGYLGNGWARVGSSTGGYGVDNDAAYRNVYGIATDTSYSNGQTYLNGLYLSGNFRKSVGAVVNHNAAKWNGSTWRNLGLGLVKAGIDPDTCAIEFGPIPEYQGNCVVFANSTAYVGGLFDDVQDRNGLNYNRPFDDGCACGICGFWQLSVSRLNSSEILASDSGVDIRGVAFCMALKSTTPYVGGSFSTDDLTQDFYAAKLVSGVWQPLPVATAVSPEEPPVSATADSTSVYFATSSGVFRYIH